MYYPLDILVDRVINFWELTGNCKVGFSSILMLFRLIFGQMFPVLLYYIEQKIKFGWYHINREKNETLVGKKSFWNKIQLHLMFFEESFLKWSNFGIRIEDIKNVTFISYWWEWLIEMKSSSDHAIFSNTTLIFSAHRLFTSFIF